MAHANCNQVCQLTIDRKIAVESFRDQLGIGENTCPNCRETVTLTEVSADALLSYLIRCNKVNSDE